MEKVTRKLMLPYVKFIASESSLHNSGNLNRGSVSTQRGGVGREMGGRFKREGIYVYLWLASLSLGFSRQEHWSGLPFPSPMHESEFAQLCLTFSNPMDCSPPGSSIHGIFQAKHPTGVGCHCLLQLFCLDFLFLQQTNSLKNVVGFYSVCFQVPVGTLKVFFSHVIPECDLLVCFAPYLFLTT